MNEQEQHLRMQYQAAFSRWSRYHWDRDKTHLQLTPTQRLPKKAAIEGCSCSYRWGGWRCMSFRHQLEARHLAVQYQLDQLVLDHLIRLSYRHGWDERRLARPPMEVLADLGVSLHFASKLGLLRGRLDGVIEYEAEQFAEQQYKLTMQKHNAPAQQKFILRQIANGSYLIDAHPNLTFLIWKDADSDVLCSGCGGQGWDYIYCTDGGGTDDWYTYGDCCLEEIEQ